MATKLLFFGNERIATGIDATAPIFRTLLAAGYDIVGLVLAQKETSRSRTTRELEIQTIAQQHNIPVLTPHRLRDVQDELKEFGAEAAVLVAYGKIVPQSVIDIFPRGIINIHPSLLPKHRGSIPIESVILNGESNTGVSLMALSAEMDAGPLYAQQSLPVTSNETKATLATRLRELSSKMLLSHLPAILDGSLEAISQNSSDATYDTRITKEIAEIDWHKTATELEREIRAYAGWPRSRAVIGTTNVIITESHTLSDSSGLPGTLWLDGKQLGVYCGEGVLVIDKLIPVGKKEMSAQAFVAGYQPS